MFALAMETLASLKEPVDAFFANVKVNTDDGERRANRLALLRAINAVMNQVADFSHIEG
jgi:glycyl-tRNA synthetase beta chain